MTNTIHPMDRVEPSNPFFEDIFDEQELAQHERDISLMKLRHARQDLSKRKAKIVKFDKFLNMILTEKKITLDVIKKHELSLNDVISICYSVIADFIFDENLFDHLLYITTERDNQTGWIDEISEFRKEGKRYEYLEEAMIVAFSKYRGGKINRYLPKLQDFFGNIEQEKLLEIRNFYVNNNGASDAVRLVHKVICAYKFDNRDNQKEKTPLDFDYDERRRYFSNFFQFFTVLFYNLHMVSHRDSQELINKMIKEDLYHYSEIHLFQDIICDND